MTINTQLPYRVMTGQTELFSGTYNQCLSWVADTDETLDCTIHANNADAELNNTLIDEELNYNYED